MSGLRDLSIIATPPAHRLAVQTFIAPWDPVLLREAFQRELARGGQVYFLHNEVESIEKMARELAGAGARGAHPHRPRADARARTGTGDARFPPPALQRAGVHHHHRIAASTSPTPTPSSSTAPTASAWPSCTSCAGASAVRTTAPMPTWSCPNKKSITADAKKRLEAIASLDELGAGFTLATHDLEIRGAGELLGEDQSGADGRDRLLAVHRAAGTRGARRSRPASCPTSTPADAPRRRRRAAHRRADPGRLPARRRTRA